MGRAVFFNVSGGGHVIATYGLVEELVGRGEEVIYYEAPHFQAEIEALGAEFRCYPEIRPYEGPLAQYPYHHELGLPPVMTWCALEWIPQLLEPVREAQPDYIVHDSLCIWGRVIAQLLGVPAFSSIHTPALSLPLVLGQRQFWLHMPKMILKGFASRRYFWRLERQMRQTYGLPRMTSFDACTNPQPVNICHAPRELQPRDAGFADGYHFIGSVHNRPSHSNFPLAELAEPFIYIGFGTICDPGVTFFRNCIRAFADLDMQVVMILSHSTTREDLGPIPSNFLVWSLRTDGLAPQFDILPRASLFIMNGGNGGARESSWFSVPMIAVPTTFEVDMISRRIEEQGAGIRIPPHKASPERLREAVSTVLAEPSYRDNSARIGDACRKAGGGRRAAELIMETVYGTTHGSTHSG